MKIFVAGSMNFAQKMLDVQKLLNGLGFDAYIPPDTDDCVQNPELNMDDEHNFSNDIMRECMDIQEKCDAILVLNYSRFGINGYIGAHTLIELGLAYYLRQKIYLLYKIPPQEELRMAQEVMHMKPTILEGDIRSIVS